MFLVALTVMTVSRFDAIDASFETSANGPAEYEVMRPVVDLEEESVTTWSSPDTNQF